MAVLPDPALSQALLVGVHEYANLDDLPAVAHNLTGLQGVLTDPAVWGLPADHCRVLAQPVDVTQVVDAVQEVAGRARDTLLVYYAGHGLTDPYSEELYLAVPGSKQDRVYTWLRYEYLRRAVLDPAAGARRTVVILDCCYSGRALLGRMGTGDASEQIADHAMVEGSCVLASSAETRLALAPPGEEYTAFSGELIAALSEGIPDAPDPIDMNSLYRHLYRVLAAKSRPLPQQRNRNTGGLIALARNRAAAPPPPPVPPPPPPPPATPATPVTPAPVAPMDPVAPVEPAAAPASAPAPAPAAAPSSAPASPPPPAHALAPPKDRPLEAAPFPDHAAAHEPVRHPAEVDHRAETTRLLEKIARERTRDFGSDNPDTLNARHHHACHLGETGQHAEAARLLKEIARDRVRVLGFDHPDTLTTRHERARNLGKAGRHVEAARLFEQVAQDRAHVLGIDHPETLAARHNYAFYLGEAGQRTEAARLMEYFVQDWVRVRGFDHPDTLTARYEHARNLGKAGRYAEAARVFEEVTQDWGRVLGTDHPDTLAVRHNHAFYLGEAGRYAEAVRLFREVVRDRVRVLGADHPDTLTARHNHAFYTRTLGQHAAASRLMAEIARDRARALGSRLHRVGRLAGVEADEADEPTSRDRH